MSKKEVECKDCHYGRYGPCTCEAEMAASCIPSPLTKEDKEEIKTLHGPRVTSYFLFKPSVEIPDVCYNAKSACCKDCEEPECDLCGQTFPTKESEGQST